jgi:hypothetical protein
MEKESQSPHKFIDFAWVFRCFLLFFPLPFSSSRNERRVVGSDKGIQIWEGERPQTREASPGGLKPRDLLVWNAGAHVLLLDSGNRMRVSDVDISRETVVHQKSLTCNGAEIPLTCMTPSKKWQQLEAGSVQELISVSGKILGRPIFDARSPKADFCVQDFKMWGNDFLTSVATSANKYIAVGTTSGCVRLFDPEQPLSSQKFTQAAPEGFKTGAVKSISISHDGEWVAWSTGDYVCLFKAIDKPSDRNAFVTQLPAKDAGRDVLFFNRKSVADVCEMPLENVEFSSVSFDNTCASDPSGLVTEEMLVVCIGPCVVGWKMRQLSQDFKGGRFEPGTHKAEPELLTKQSSDILAHGFDYDNTHVSALCDKLVNLDLWSGEETVTPTKQGPNRCQAKTLEGKQCKKSPSSGKSHCHVHLK